ncbi:Shikimate 5-dehydrogenase [Microlunatus sagamiharensis]|uniref:Shikimate 5-dehydrogenase n=2 Tax=Microlunatus sagamiharensis TaxID=546874 RepID=A0A1H2N3N1_9ACTN|nr:Shikimate 5-dehydrogenase [Microlunatus sagamiharensis]
MGFVGVSTGGSSILTVFPRWAEVLGLPARTLVGHDVPLDAPPEVYRDLVSAIAADDDETGALVTTHKVAVHDACADLFDELDDLSQTFGEVSCISKRDGRLLGSAKDPLTARLALEEFLPSDHFATTGASALVLGSGGAGTALSQQLGVRGDRPGQVVCTALEQGPLDHARSVHERSGVPDGLVRYVRTAGPEDVTALVEALPAGSLVVNATGMGKDRPGSPVPDGVELPRDGYVWDFNYRGSLELLAQARAQQAERGLHVEDGWRYFVHGWSQAVAEVFAVPMPPETVDELGRVAASTRAP